MSIQETLARNVRRLRMEAGLTQWDLAGKLEKMPEGYGIDQAYISHLEHGRKNPTLTTLWLIAQALDVTVAQLVEEDD